MSNPRHRRSPKNLTLNQMIPDWDSGSGIFAYLDTGTTTPWHGVVGSAGLDIAYHGQRSGDKFVAPMCYKWLDDDGEITSAGIQKLIAAIEARYFQKWSHLWDDYTATYDPLKTYQLTESGSSSGNHSDTTSRTRTPNLTTRDVLDQDDTDSHTSSGSTTYGKGVTSKSDGTTMGQNYRYGFNPDGNGTISGITGIDQYPATGSAEYENHAFSVSDVGGKPTTADKGSTLTQSSETQSGSDTESGSVSGTNTRDATNTRTETGTDATSGTDSGTESETYSRTKAGNMYRSTAELLSFDRDFWLTDYFSIVFADVDDMLTLAIYSERPINTTIF